MSIVNGQVLSHFLHDIQVILFLLSLNIFILLNSPLKALSAYIVLAITLLANLFIEKSIVRVKIFKN